jgi:PIN domain nuclease of toxin-antitoxin system
VIEADDTITCVSAVTAWELANKVRRGKWPEAAGLVEGFFEMMEHYNVVPLPITLDHARLAGSLPGRHRDPFDRMLAAQARIEDVPLVTADPAFRRFDIATLW